MTVRKHHHHAKHSGSGVMGIGKDHHHRAKTGASRGGSPHQSVGSVGGSTSHTRRRGKPGSAKGATTNEKGSRPIRLAASKGIRALAHKRKKISHDVLI